MRVLIGSVALALLAGGAAIHAQTAAPPPAPPAQAAPAQAAALLPNTQALFTSLVAENKMPGIVGAFGVGDLPTIFPAAGRISDDPGAQPAGPDSLYRIYSMTKPITGIAAMILIEEGKIGLDDKLSKYFPAFKTMRVLTSPETSLDSVPAKSEITIRELLTHSSGLSYSIVGKGPLPKEYERLGLLPATLNPQVEAQARRVRPATLQAFAERVAQAPLIAQPGTAWNYSIGLDVMGAVIEKVSGMPFDRFLQQRIFGPLRMTSTFFTVPRSEAKRLATNYVFVGETRAPIDPGATSVFLDPPSFPYGGAGLVSTARDYDRFLHMIQDGGALDGVRILKAETVALATSNLLPPGVVFTNIDGTSGTTGMKMGFGAGGSVAIEDQPNGRSKGTYGWGGAAGTIAWVDPKKRFRGTVMVQFFPDKMWNLRASVPAALLKDAARYRPQ
jgi:CubicO group peptidase (beta-lactamase class C family)